MPIAETDRMWLRPLSLEDTPQLAQILGDPQVMQHSVRGVRDEAQTRRFIEWCLACYDSHGTGPWALVHKESAAFVGFCGVGPEHIREVEEMNLGYRLAPGFWGAGLATEAARASLAHAFGVKGFSSVIAIIDPDHIASLRVAEKAGFQSFEIARFYEREVRLYRMIREQWGRSPRREG